MTAQSGVSLIGTFNNEGITDIDKIKQLSSDLVDLIQGLENNDQRRKDIACTKIEEAAMFAVKSIFS